MANDKALTDLEKLPFGEVAARELPSIYDIGGGLKARWEYERVQSSLVAARTAAYSEWSHHAVCFDDIADAQAEGWKAYVARLDAELGGTFRPGRR